MVSQASGRYVENVMEPVILDIFLKSILPSLAVGFGSAYLTAVRQFAVLQERVEQLEEDKDDLEEGQEEIESTQDEMKSSLSEISSDIKYVKTVLDFMASNQDVDNLDIDVD